MTNQEAVKRNVLSVKDALTEVFEGNISQFKLYEMVRKNEIPHVRIGSKILFRRDVLEGWMCDQEAQSSSASK
jgi:excisionase family DNA binding protein